MCEQVVISTREHWEAWIYQIRFNSFKLAYFCQTTMWHTPLSLSSVSTLPTSWMSVSPACPCSSGITWWSPHLCFVTFFLAPPPPAQHWARAGPVRCCWALRVLRKSLCYSTQVSHQEAVWENLWLILIWIINSNVIWGTFRYQTNICVKLCVCRRQSRGLF